MGLYSNFANKKKNKIRKAKFKSSSYNFCFNVFCRCKKKLLAFTLAEVLITLAIIGVVAALTIPSVIVNYQKRETVTRLKKFYTQMQQSLNIAKSEYGDIRTWEWVENNNRDSYDRFVKKYILPYNKIQQYCKTPSESNHCAKNTYKGLDNVVIIPSMTQYVSYNLIDGTSVTMDSDNKGLIWFQVDLNGFLNGPNKTGRDIFFFYLMKNAQKNFVFIAEERTLEDLRSNSMYIGCNKSNVYKNMYGCGALIQRSNWQIPKDYPW